MRMPAVVAGQRGTLVLICVHGVPCSTPFHAIAMQTPSPCAWLKLNLTEIDPRIACPHSHTFPHSCRRGDRLDWMYQGGLAAKEDAAKKAEVRPPL